MTRIFFFHLFFVCFHEWNKLLENIDVTLNAVMTKCRDFATGLQPISTPMATRRRPRMWKVMKRWYHPYGNYVVVAVIVVVVVVAVIVVVVVIFIPMVVMKRWYRVYADYVVVGDGGDGEAWLFWHGIQQEKEVCSHLHTLTWQRNIFFVFDGRKFLWSWIIWWIKRLMKREWRYFVIWNSN